jgi:hypothetical protein
MGPAELEDMVGSRSGAGSGRGPRGLDRREQRRRFGRPLLSAPGTALSYPDGHPRARRGTLPSSARRMPDPGRDEAAAHRLRRSGSHESTDVTEARPATGGRYAGASMGPRRQHLEIRQGCPTCFQKVGETFWPYPPMTAYEREILERAVHAVARMGRQQRVRTFLDIAFGRIRRLGRPSENIYSTRSANTTRRSDAENLGLQVVSTSVGLFV